MSFPRGDLKVDGFDPYDGIRLDPLAAGRCSCGTATAGRRSMRARRDPPAGGVNRCEAMARERYLAIADGANTDYVLYPCSDTASCREAGGEVPE